MGTYKWYQSGRLLMGDFERYGPRGTNECSYGNYEGVPYDTLTGYIAESWEVLTDPACIRFHIRPGIYWRECAIMDKRELTADDIVYSLEWKRTYARSAQFLDFVEEFVATDRYTVDLIFKDDTYNIRWVWCAALGHGCIIFSEELNEAGDEDWTNHLGWGCGPFMLSDYIEGSSVTYARDPDYWRTTTIDGVEYQTPFVDTLVEAIIPDVSTRIASLRTGALDMAGQLPATYAEMIRTTCPDVVAYRHAHSWGIKIACNMSQDWEGGGYTEEALMVRRALALAIDQEAIGDGVFIEWMWTFPFHPDIWPDVALEPEEMAAAGYPNAARLYDYDPDAARQLLADAGYPNGFTTQLTYSSGTQVYADTCSMIADYWDEIGVTCTLNPTVDYMSVMMNSLYDGTFHNYLCTTNIMALADAYHTGYMWNGPDYSREWWDEMYDEMCTETDTATRNAMMQELGYRPLEEDAPYIPLTGYMWYFYGWPWVKNWYGEINVAWSTQEPIYADIWIDEDLKEELGY